MTITDDFFYGDGDDGDDIFLVRSKGDPGPQGIRGADGPIGPSGPLSVYGTDIFVIQGDSLSEDTIFSSYRVNYPYQLWEVSDLFRDGIKYNFAVSGQTAATMETNYTTQITPLAPNINLHQRGYFMLLAGINDILQGLGTAADIYARLTTMWASARAEGFVVIASTVAPCNHALWWVAGTMEPIRVALNTLILSAPNLYDAIIRPDLLFPDPDDGTYYIDALHFSENASYVIAQNIARRIQRLSTTNRLGDFDRYKEYTTEWYKKALHSYTNDTWVSVVSFIPEGKQIYTSGYIEITASGRGEASISECGAKFTRWYYSFVAGSLTVTKVGTDIDTEHCPEVQVIATDNIITVQVRSYNTNNFNIDTFIDAKLSAGAYVENGMYLGVDWNIIEP